MKYAVACLKLGEGNNRLLKWKTESESVVCPCLNQGCKFMIT